MHGFHLTVHNCISSQTCGSVLTKQLLDPYYACDFVENELLVLFFGFKNCLLVHENNMNSLTNLTAGKTLNERAFEIRGLLA